MLDINFLLTRPVTSHSKNVIGDSYAVSEADSRRYVIYGETNNRIYYAQFNEGTFFSSNYTSLRDFHANISKIDKTGILWLMINKIYYPNLVRGAMFQKGGERIVFSHYERNGTAKFDTYRPGLEYIGEHVVDLSKWTNL